jgi:hypothetical protein
MSGDSSGGSSSNNSNEDKVNRKTHHHSIVGTPTPEVNAKHREKALAAGTRRNQGVIKLRDTGDENFMTVIRDQHTRRKLLDNESKKGLPEGTMIYDPKKPIDSREFFKDEVFLGPKKNKNKSDIHPAP